MQFSQSSALAPVHFASEAPSTFELVDEHAPNWTTWVTLNQTAGRGRIDRRWQTPPGQALAACVLVRPSEGHGWTPLATGLAVQRAIGAVSEGSATIKWPNDVLVDGKKIAGILCELRGGAVIIGFGVNLLQERDALLPTATSLRQQGAGEPAHELADFVLANVLRSLQHDIPRLGTFALAQEIAAACSTLGQRVRAELPAGESVEGTALRLSDDGGLVVDTGDGEVTVTAGDIVHLRPSGVADASQQYGAD